MTFSSQMAPITMTPDAQPADTQPPRWQLLAEFAPATLPEMGERLLSQIMFALQDLQLQPPQKARIQQLCRRAVQRATRQPEQSAHVLLRVRIWLLRICTGDCGWGFYLVESRGEEVEAATGGGCLVQLFLYQERAL